MLTIFIYAIQALLAIGLTRGLGIWIGSLVYAVMVLVMVIVAGELLRNSQVNRITWRNRIAGWFLPWSMLVGGGSLNALRIKNAVASVVFGWLAVLGDHWLWPSVRASADAATGPSVETWFAFFWGLATGLGWIIMTAGWLVLLKSYLKGRTEPVSALITNRNQRLPMILPPIAVGTSIALRCAGFSGLAFCVVWIPLLLVFMPVLLMLLVILTYSIRGKPIRWN